MFERNGPQVDARSQCTDEVTHVNCCDPKRVGFDGVDGQSFMVRLEEATKGDPLVTVKSSIQFAIGQEEFDKVGVVRKDNVEVAIGSLFNPRHIERSAHQLYVAGRQGNTDSNAT